MSEDQSTDSKDELRLKIRYTNNPDGTVDLVDTFTDGQHEWTARITGIRFNERPLSEVVVSEERLLKTIEGMLENCHPLEEKPCP
jgi:hypothetical protein